MQVVALDLLHVDGSIVPAEVSSVGMVGPDGRFAGITGATRDISERTRLLRELRESEERYRSVVQSTPDLIWAADGEGRYTFVSDRVTQLLGYQPDQVLGRHFGELVEGDWTAYAATALELLRGEPGRPQTYTVGLRTADGHHKPFEVSTVALVEDGEIAALYGVARDISERQRLERELRESEERYRFLVQSSPDLIWTTDANGLVTFVSDAIRSILGWEPDEVIGRPFVDLAPKARRREVAARFRRIARRPTLVGRTRLPVMTKDGRELTFEVTGIGMVADGRFAGAHGAARDVSERERLDRDLRRQAAELAAGEERAHLARELHDSVTQALDDAAVALDRDAPPAGPRAGPGQARLPARAPAGCPGRDAGAHLRAPPRQRRRSRPHRRPANARGGAVGRIGLPVVLEGELAERPPIQVEETMYRIAQEALHNVVKHAGAREVRIEVGRVPDGVRLQVQDDGKGFDPETVPEATSAWPACGREPRSSAAGSPWHRRPAAAPRSNASCRRPAVEPTAAELELARDI